MAAPADESGRQDCKMLSDAEGLTKHEIAARMKRRKAGVELGQRTEDFDLQGLLGRGSYASVYKAFSRNSNRQVAIKVIDKQLIAACPGLADRVRYEAETHISLDHPSIVRLHTFFEDHSRVYLVMDLCEGGELYQYLRKRGEGLPVGEARRMFRQAVQGVQHLHSQNIAHRDLKPSNLLLTSDLQVKISDLGLSVTLAGEGGESGTVCGTPNYMAPEVICRAPHGLSSDVWALGCLLYTLLVGCPPFESSTIEATLDRISRVQYQIPSQIPETASDLIQKLLIKEPALRMPLEDILEHGFVRDRATFSQQHADTPQCPRTAISRNFGIPQAQTPPVPSAQPNFCRLNGGSSRDGQSSNGQGTEPSAQRLALEGHVQHCSSSPSPHFNSGMALRDRRGMVSRSWDPHSEQRLQAAESKYGSANGKCGSSENAVAAHGLHGGIKHEHAAGHTGGRNEEAGAHRRGECAEGAGCDVRSSDGWAAIGHVVTTAAETQSGRLEQKGSALGLHLSLSEVRSSLQDLLPQRPVQHEGSFASTMLSARSHTVATPVQSCRTVAEQRGTGGVPRLAQNGNARMGAATVGGHAVTRIDARRMKPHRYDTKHAEVVIDKQGTVFVVAKGSEAVMRVELGGETIRVLTQRPSKRGMAVPKDLGTQHPAAAGSGIEEERYSLDQLPVKWLQLYAYAAKVLTLIQSKTPKVVYYSPYAKAQLMEDGRAGKPPSFVCEFYNGRKTQSIQGSREMVVVSREPTKQRAGSAIAKEGEDEGQLIAHAQECLQICHNAEAKCAKSSQNRSSSSVDSSGGSRGPFPAVFAHKLAMHHLRADQSEAAHAGSRQGSEQPPATLHREQGSGSAGRSTTHLSVSDVSQRSAATSDKRSRASTAASTAQHSPSHSQLLAPADTGAESVQGGASRQPGTGAAQERENGELHLERLGEEGRVFEFEAACRPVVAKAAFFEGLGWMLTLEDGSVWGQLPDGSQVVATDSQVVAVTAAGERIAAPVEHGQLQEGAHVCMPPKLRLSAQHVLSLRDVL